DLRLRAPPAEPGETRLVGGRADAQALNAIVIDTISIRGEQHGAEKTEIGLYNRENIFSAFTFWGSGPAYPPQATTGPTTRPTTGPTTMPAGGSACCSAGG